MVAGSKVKLTMGFQKPSPATPKPETPKRSSPSPSSAKSSQKAVFSRSFGVYFPRSSAQVQPRPPDVAELLRLVEELRERESHLKTKIIEQKLLKQSAAIVPFLENEISSKNAELEVSVNKIESLESENERLRREMENLQARIEDERRDREKIVKEMEEEILELKKTISERNGVVESKLICNETGDNEVLSSSQRFTGLIDSSVRLNLLRNLKRGGRSTDIGLNHENQKIEIVDPKREMESERIQHQSRCNNVEEGLEISESVITTVQCRGPRVPNPPPRPSSSPPSPTSSSSSTYSTSTSSDTSVISDSNVSTVKTVLINLPPAAPPPPPPPRPTARTAPAPPPPPPPPPRPMGTTTRAPPSLFPPRPMAITAPAPPPPPPLPIKGAKTAANKVKRVPEVVEFYHSLMRRDSKKESGVGGSEVPAPFASRDMIGEIENRSTHLLAIKTDVETQGDFIRFLIKEVESAAFTNIEDVVAFVKWLDDELSHLVDERAVLKHFEWPEQKADALREAAFGYCDLKKLEKEASTFSDDIRQPCGSSLKKMQNLLEKLEHGVYNLSRMRESATNKYRGYRIPSDWMLESGIVNQIKLVSVKLAMKYMQRVSLELEVAGGAPELEELMLQGVRFAFRVHQFAGGFDVETMTAFQELRNKSRSCHIQCQNQQQQKLFCRSTTC